MTSATQRLRAAGSKLVPESALGSYVGVHAQLASLRLILRCPDLERPRRILERETLGGEVERVHLGRSVVGAIIHIFWVVLCIGIGSADSAYTMEQQQCRVFDRDVEES